MAALRSLAALGAATALCIASVSRPAAERGSTAVLRYIAGSTAKVEQLLGEQDLERRQPTLSRTVTRFGLEGTDLGNSFEHNGKVYFLFGDTVGWAARALDSIGVTDARDAESGVRLDFLTTASPVGPRGGGRRGGRAGRAATMGDHPYMPIQIPGVSMGAFEVPVAGISLNGKVYVVVSTNHTDDRKQERSVLTTFTPPETFKAGRVISQLPSGHFVKMSLHAQTSAVADLPSGGPFVYMWGTGVYRESDVYFALTPASSFESGRNTRYFAGVDGAGAPKFSERQADATPIVKNGTIGDVSVTWCAPLGVWLMTYDSRPPAEQGIEFSYATTPWGPWSRPQVIFHPQRDGALGKFIHNPRGTPPDSIVGPVIGQGTLNPAGTRGGAYAPYVVERWTRVAGNELTIYYTLSTWNPYVVVLMRSKIAIG